MIFFKEYWPLGLIILWFTYRWWSTQRVKSMLPLLKSQNAIIIDVRSESEYLKAHIPLTVNIPLLQIQKREKEIPKNRPIIVCCASGSRSTAAKRILKNLGYKEVYNIGSWLNLS